MKSNKKSVSIKEAEEFLSEPISEDEALSFLSDTPEGRMLESGKSVLTTAGQAMQIPGAAIRAPIASTIAGKGPIAGVQELVEGIKSEGTEAVEQFSGEKIAEQLGMEEGLGRTATGFGIDVATDPLTYSANWMAKLVASPFKSVAAKQAAKSIAKYVSKAKYGKEGVNPEILGGYIVDRGITKYLNNPKKMKEVISGTSEIVSKGPKGLQVTKEAVNRDSGMIGAIYNDLTKSLLEHSDVPTRPLKDIADSVVVKFGNRMQTDYAYPMDDKVQAAIVKNVKDYLKLYPGGNDPTKSLPVKMLNDIRTMLNKKVNAKDFHSRVNAGDTAAMLEKDVIKSILDELKNEIHGALDTAGATVKFGNTKIPASQYYEAQNSAINKLIQLDELLDPVGLENLKKSDLAQIASQVITGVGAGVGLGSMWSVPVQGAAVGGAYGIARTAMDVAKEKTPGVVAKALTTLPESQGIKLAPEITANILKKVGEFTSGGGREPQSVNIPEQLVRTPVPRSTEEVLQKKEFVKMKIAQMYPDMYEQVAETLDNYPEFIEDMMPLMAIQMPGLFPKDKYNRIDGKIFGPQDKARAIKDVYDDGSLSNTQKALKIQRLNLTGEFR